MSFDDVYDLFMRDYGTEENYLRVFGGQVTIKSAEVSEEGKLKLVFSRGVVFPVELVLEYNPGYNERIPVLEPTEAEK